jgi:nicotinamidase-related amidase
MPLLARDSLLLVVDLQQRLAPAMEAIDPALAATTALMKAAALLDVPILLSEQYPKGLGPTVPEIAALAPPGATLSKMHFSAAADPVLADRIRASGRKGVVIAGIEAHVCVLQTALDLRAHGYRVAVAADATASRRAASRIVALERMARRGVEIVTAEMCLFEWLGSAHHPAFKAVSALIR